MTVLPIRRPLGVSEAERKRDGGGRTGKLPLGATGYPSPDAPSPSSSAVAHELAALHAELAHLSTIVAIQGEILLRLTAKKEPTSAA